jgi:hypothetical protein
MLFKKRDPQLDRTLVDSGSGDLAVATKNMREIAKALELPLRKGIMSGDIIGDIFEPVDMRNVRSVEFPLDFLQPGTEGDHTAYVIPNCGYIPMNSVQGDYVTVPTYMVGNSIDWCLKYARDANWNVVDRATEVFRDGFVKKFNDDGAHVLLAAGLDRNIIVTDSAASADQFTKRLVSLMQVVMRRNGGGNSSSVNRGKLTDLYISPEAMEDIRNWNVDQIDEVTRREIFVNAGEESLSRIFGVNIHTWDELGQGQEYQLYYENDLGGTLPAGDVELVLGLDLSRSDSFVMPVREDVQTFEDMTLHRQMRAGLYGWAEVGMAVLNSQRVLLGAI